MTVQPIQGEIGRYLVSSTSSPGNFHMVDLLEGECGCAAWVCNHRKFEQETGKGYRCRHILKAREYCLDQFIETMRDHVLSK